MPTRLRLKTPENFSFKHTIYAHGWSELAPFEIDEEKWLLSYVFRNGEQVASGAVSEDRGGLKIEVSGEIPAETILRDVRHILRLDDPLEEFYRLTGSEERLAWVGRVNAGRLLRSPTVFEDLVKTICTTNCSWSLTRKMVGNLVAKLGIPAPDGKRAFPTAEVMASQTEEFYRSEIRAGYRSPYFVELGEAVVSRKIDPESWLHSDRPTAELKKEIKKVKGMGDYGAENLLKLLGRYDGLALDSWLRAQFYKKHNREKTCPDKKIERHYKKFGHWKGLAIWCDMTEGWFDGRF